MNNKGFGILELLVCLVMIGIIAPPVYKLMFQSFTMSQQLTTSATNASIVLSQLNTAIANAKSAANQCQTSCQQPSPSPSPVKESDPCDH